MGYETLDTIADSYIPVLGVISLLVMLTLFSDLHGRVKIILIRGLVMSLLLGIAYGFMFLDKAYSFWPKIGLDYSTHTAVALALIIYLNMTIPKLWHLWVISLLLYISLMLFQKYHTVADIASTIFIFFLSIIIIFAIIKHRVSSLIHRKNLLQALPILQSVKY